VIYVYIGCLAFGAFYSIASLFLGGHGFDHGGHDGIHIGHGDGADAPSAFNPLVIASAITAFGAVGIIAKLGMGSSDTVSLISALLFAGVTGAIIFFGIVKLMYSSQSNSTFSQEDLLGMEAKVITTIPQNGMGEISYVVNGIRNCMAAKSLNNSFIGREEIVKINEVSGNIAMVTKKLTVDDLTEYGTEGVKDKQNLNNQF
jgi:hypothetical protein